MQTTFSTVMATKAFLNFVSTSACRRVAAKKRVHFVKFVHDILPTNKILNRYDSRESALCPRCNLEVETRDHMILLCDMSMAWRSSFLEVIRKRCVALNTRPILRDALLLGITHWFSQATTPLEISVDDDDIITMMKNQSTIGWRHIFNGRFCNDWAILQGVHYGDNRDQTTSPKGTQWTAEIISTIWSEWYKLWETRNSAVHGTDAASQRAIQRTHLLRRLSELYSRRRQVEPSLVEVFDIPEETHAQRGLTYLKNWLTMYEPMVMDSVARATKKAISGMRSIRSYFTTFQAEATG